MLVLFMLFLIAALCFATERLRQTYSRVFGFALLFNHEAFVLADQPDDSCFCHCR